MTVESIVLEFIEIDSGTFLLLKFNFSYVILQGEKREKDKMLEVTLCYIVLEVPEVNRAQPPIHKITRYLEKIFWTKIESPISEKNCTS